MELEKVCRFDIAYIYTRIYVSQNERRLKRFDTVPSTVCRYACSNEYGKLGTCASSLALFATDVTGCTPCDTYICIYIYICMYISTDRAQSLTGRSIHSSEATRWNNFGKERERDIYIYLKLSVRDIYTFVEKLYVSFLESFGTTLTLKSLP